MSTPYLEVVIVPHRNYLLNDSGCQVRRSHLPIVRVIAPFACDTPRNCATLSFFSTVNAGREEPAYCSPAVYCRLLVDRLSLK